MLKKIISPFYSLFVHNVSLREKVDWPHLLTSWNIRQLLEINNTSLEGRSSSLTFWHSGTFFVCILLMSLGGWQTAFSCITLISPSHVKQSLRRPEFMSSLRSRVTCLFLILTKKFFCETLTKCFPKLNNVFFAPKLDHTSFPNPNQALFMHEYNRKKWYLKHPGRMPRAVTKSWQVTIWN